MKKRITSILVIFCMLMTLFSSLVNSSKASTTDISQYIPPTVEVEGVKILADGEYYLQMLGKWVYPVWTNCIWMELSDKKPEKPFKISLISFDKERGPKYSITYDGVGVGAQSISGQQLSSMYAPNWKISVYTGFSTIRDYTNQALLVMTSGASNENGTKVLVWKQKGSAPDHGKVIFYTPENAPAGPEIPLLSSNPAPSGKSTTLADGWYRLKMGGETSMSMQGYLDFNNKGYFQLKYRGVVGDYEAKDRTDNQKFYVENIGKGQITLRTTDGKYLGISGSIKDGSQLKAIDKPYLWKVDFSKVGAGYGTSNITYGALRPSGNKKYIAAATLYMEDGFSLSDNYTIKDGSEIFIRSSAKFTPENASFAFIPVSAPTSASWYSIPASGKGGSTKSLSVGNLNLKISNVYSMGANINIPGKNDMAGYLMHMYFIVAATPGKVKLSYTDKLGIGATTFWPLNNIKFTEKSIPKPIYPDRDYAADYDDAEVFQLKKGTTTITNNALYDITYQDGKAIPGYRNGNYWSIQIFFVDNKTAAKSVGTPKKYPAGQGTNNGTYVVYSVK